MKTAAFSLAETKFAGGEFAPVVLQNVTHKAQMKVLSKKENVAGVRLPTFEHYEVRFQLLYLLHNKLR